jgi:hypothetical protein
MNPTNGFLELRDTNAATVVATGTIDLATGTDFRLEHILNAGAGTQTLNVYVGANKHGTTPTETISGTFTVGNWDRANFGIIAATTNWTLYTDAVKGNSSTVGVGPAVTAPALVQQKSTSGTASSSAALTATWLQNTVAGNCGWLVVAINEWNVTGAVAENAGIPDLSAQGWTRVTGADANGARAALYVYVKPNIGVADSSVSILLPSATGARSVVAWLIEESTIATTLPVDAAIGALSDNTITTFDTGVTGSATTQASEVVYAAIVQQFEPGGTITPTTGENWGSPIATPVVTGTSQEGITLGIYRKVLTATQTLQFSGTLSLSRRWAANLVSLKVAGSSPSTLGFAAVQATGWTVTGGAAIDVISDALDSTYLTSSVGPSSQALDLTIQPIETPTGDLVISTRANRVDATSASIVATLRDGTTTVATAATVNPGAAVGDLTITFPSADISSVTQTKWRAGTLVVRLAVTAT